MYTTRKVQQTGLTSVYETRQNMWGMGLSSITLKFNFICILLCLKEIFKTLYQLIFRKCL